MNKFLPKLWSTILLIVLGFSTIVGVVGQIAHNPNIQSWPWQDIMMLVIGIVIYFIFSFLGFYYLIARIKKRGICWDHEGVYIDFSNHKLYWHEIEAIHLKYYPGIGKTTIISTYPKYGSDIKERFDKWRVTSLGYSFDLFWISVEKPKVMHEQLLSAFQHYQKGIS